MMWQASIVHLRCLFVSLMFSVFAFLVRLYSSVFGVSAYAIWIVCSHSLCVIELAWCSGFEMCVDFVFIRNPCGKLNLLLNLS